MKATSTRPEFPGLLRTVRRQRAAALAVALELLFQPWIRPAAFGAEHRSASSASDRPALTVVTADSDGILDAAALVRPDSAPESVRNPFRFHAHPAIRTRDVPLAVQAVLVGSRPDLDTVIIDGRAYSPGDRLQGMEISAITADSIDLRLSAAVLRIPVRDEPVTLRLPR